MKFRDVSFVALGVVLAVVVGLGHSVATAQPAPEKPAAPKTQVTQVDGMPEDQRPLLSSDNLALRVEREKDGRVVGVLMAKVGGKWKPVELTAGNAFAR